MEKSDHRLTSCLIPIFLWTAWPKGRPALIRVADVPAEIEAGHLQDQSQKLWPLNQFAQQQYCRANLGTFPLY
jgi:hypothetical protein